MCGVYKESWLQREALDRSEHYEHWVLVATWAVGITAFMIFKWTKEIAGPQGLQCIAGKDGRKVYFSIPKEIKQNKEAISKLEETVASQGKAAIDEVKELAQTANRMAEIANTLAGVAINSNVYLSQELVKHNTRIEALEKVAK